MANKKPLIDSNNLDQAKKFLANGGMMKTLEENRYRKIVNADARRVAWASIMNEVNVKEEIEKQRKQKVKRQLKTQETANILTMYK